MPELGIRILKVATRGVESRNRSADALRHPRATALQILFTALAEDGVTPYGMAQVESLTFRAKDGDGVIRMLSSLDTEDLTTGLTASQYAAGGYHAAFEFEDSETNFTDTDGEIRLAATVTAVLSDGAGTHVLLRDSLIIFDAGHTAGDPPDLTLSYPSYTGVAEPGDILRKTASGWEPGAEAPDKHYTHTQSVPSAQWAVAHNLGKRPSVAVFDSAWSEWAGGVAHVDENNLTITFSSAFSGVAYLN
jgi:hypothetical protein